MLLYPLLVLPVLQPLYLNVLIYRNRGCSWEISEVTVATVRSNTVPQALHYKYFNYYL